MDIRSALKSQYHGALAMLRQEIERCPDELWHECVDGRPFWHLVHHTLFFTHFYSQPSMDGFQRWEKDRGTGSPDEPPFTREELMEYWQFCGEGIDGWIDALDLDAAECGFYWYKMPKLDHQIMNIRHIQQHAGQLSERLYAAGVDLDWVGSGLS